MAKTSLTSLELFLLELIKEGANTPYLLKEKAGVSVGAALPALNRLADRGLIRRGTASARNRQEYELTAAGRKASTLALEELLEAAIGTPPSDTDSLLRVIALALAEHKKKDAVEILSRAVQARASLARARTGKTLYTENGDLATLYRALAGAWDLARLRAEEGTLRLLSRRLRARS